MDGPDLRKGQGLFKATYLFVSKYVRRFWEVLPLPARFSLSVMLMIRKNAAREEEEGAIVKEYVNVCQGYIVVSSRVSYSYHRDDDERRVTDALNVNYMTHRRSRQLLQCPTIAYDTI